ncbi:CbrC family protein [Streptomyces sp. NPDC060020]
MTELPAFPYHPDPMATGAVVRSEGTCARCGQARERALADRRPPSGP